MLRAARGRCARRASPCSARCASVFQTFWPFTTHSSPSRTARVERPARSEPEPGSEKSWHHTSSPVNIGRSARLSQLVAAVRHHRRPGEVEIEEQHALRRRARRPRGAGSRRGAARGARGRARRSPPGKCTHARPRSYCAPRNVTGSVERGSCAASRSSMRASTLARVVGHGSSLFRLFPSSTWWSRCRRRRESPRR